MKDISDIKTLVLEFRIITRLRRQPTTKLIILMLIGNKYINNKLAKASPNTLMLI